MNQFTERQGHGFKYEEEVINRYNLTAESNYTAKWDAYFKGIPVSIKTCTKKGSVYMGDFIRNATLTHNFILIIGFWELGTDGGKVFDDDIILYINKEVWLEQFPSVAVEAMRTVFDGVTNSYDDDNLWAMRKNAYNNYWDCYGTGIKVNFKRDHKVQKRIQCSIRREFLSDILIPYYQTTLDAIYINEEDK